ncbi:cytidine and deoxycytidylate deaminase zinc-binding region [Leptospira inadai serovar Lyme str. 10]|uniref:Cytidine and deoxycytidylate deaminase zinc-binding region n=2 Tax=Leptospira inadai serovar Lyme TaxID=293084 RepID=V6HB31_9LEPT|nr:bifunctional diaminohydroxyphosphoribosylaminopyrimidine deaminase/5-amino-6-(5-phosphoribosylamino)uracil reductase [Leptospira inadai]EQA36751.1 cytidine and deoxycytidylate deaminase zinc-binding region [Leptospira inadai serovar Lyme str. 10]PNV76437.1 bifunctional diaminohydroxyphosphoribosylaminopyrimidine deaminase/5-amino-6-(5-phosphoribosylamino)uracil reductase [Leptospira inadai serovar Lyme]
MNSRLPKEIREELLRLSFLSTGYSSPNPPVACVITDAFTDKILATGRTQIIGGNHAEREAYKSLREKYKTDSLPAHKVYVTLEPCSHFGKTPPCLDLLLEEKPLAVIYGWKDPNPLVRKRDSLQELERVGIQVVLNSELADIASSFLFGFAERIRKGRPALLLKSSVSREGFYSSGRQFREKISSQMSDYFLSYLRSKMDAILVGPRTIEVDSPKLDFRSPKEDSETLKKLQEVESYRDSSNLKKGFSGLISEILRSSADLSVRRIHREMERFYQPLRVFFLPAETELPPEFLTIQEELNSRYEKRNIAFFLENEKEYSKNLLSRIEKLSDAKVKRYSSKSFGKQTLKDLADWGMNTALVEGGNLLYREFSKEMENSDSILRIRSGTVTLEKGDSPDWGTNLTLEFQRDIDSDTWEVFTTCSQD